MAVTKPVTVQDLDKSMLLLKEYAERLNRLCLEKERHDFRRDLSVFASFVVLAIVATMAMLVLATGASSSFLVVIPPIILVLVVISAAWAFRFHISQIGSRRSSSHSEQIASIVLQLIRMASQYQEHSRFFSGARGNTHVSDEFEFSLRLSEAELALENYFQAYRINPDEFRKRWSSDSKGSSSIHKAHMVQGKMEKANVEEFKKGQR